jgi:hypothetical protein
MQYGELITRSFTIMWRHRYLWLLAILGGADVGSGFGFSGNLNAPFRGITPGVSPAVSQFLQDHLGLIVTVVVFALLGVLAWFLLSCVTTGALVRASAEHDAERPFRFGLAWRTGLGTFWSILGLRLLGLVLGLLVVALLGLLALLGFLAYSGGQSGALALVVVVGVLLVLALIPAAVLVGIAFILATRSVVLEQRGAVAGLGRALHLLQVRLGRVLLVWLIQVGLALAAAFVLAIPLIGVLAVLGGLILGLALGVGAAAAVVVGVPIGLAVLAGLVVLGGMTGSYFSTYWTLAFRRMELDTPRPAVAWPSGYPPQPPAGYSPPPAG